MITTIGDDRFCITYNSGTDEFTVSLGWCNVAGVELDAELEGIGETLPEALRDLACQLEDRLADEEAVVAG